VDYQKIQEDIAWTKAVIPDFDIAMTTSNSNKRERSMEAAQPVSKKAKTTNGGTWSSSFAEVVKDRKIIGVIDQSDEGGSLGRFGCLKIVWRNVVFNRLCTQPLKIAV